MLRGGWSRLAALACQAHVADRHYTSSAARSVAFVINRGGPHTRYLSPMVTDAKVSEAAPALPHPGSSSSLVKRNSFDTCVQGP